MTHRVFVAYFDCLGFECILDATAHERKAIFSALKNEQHPRFPLPEMILRAKFNPQRSPEIWMFNSEIALEDLKVYAEEDPQFLADLIRSKGQALYTTPKERRVIE